MKVQQSCRKLIVGLALLVMLPALSSWAIDAESLQDPVLQKRYVSIITELRCMVCQNQSIQDSNADLAKDLRRQVRNLLEQNKSDQEIMDYMVQRYGDYVRYRPPLRWSTAALWFGPVLIAVLGLWMLAGTLRHHLASNSSTETND